jgi:2-amino-4-hydroxy-6-hydroxymethyldihydropteridine diphosphokinase
MPIDVYIGMGSNLDQPLTQLNKAVEAMNSIAQTTVTGCSPVYRSAPVGYTDQPDFVNAVCELQTSLSATDMLKQLRESGQRYGPRTLDLDLLLYGQQQINQPGLIVPHPRLHERAFVLYPLSDLEPDLQIPGHGPLAELKVGCSDQVLNRIDQALHATSQQPGARKV